MTTVSEPGIDERPEKPYMGIRTQTPFKGMFAIVDQLRKELYAWFKAQNVEPEGPAFLRYHVIDMAGEMDIEFGVQVTKALSGDERVSAGVLPAGRYASLIYVGSGMTGNKTLIEWAKANGIVWDRWDDEKGDAFRCRTEIYLTDARVEHRDTLQQLKLCSFWRTHALTCAIEHRQRCYVMRHGRVPPKKVFLSLAR